MNTPSFIRVATNAEPGGRGPAAVKTRAVSEKSRNRRRWLLASFLAVAVFAGAFAIYVVCAPLAPLEGQGATPGTVVLDRNGAVLQRDTTQGIRIPVELDAVAPAVVTAIVAAEDQRFRWHPGVDPVAMVRAAVHLPRTRSGASTITQQLARNLYLDGGSGPLAVRKAREVVLALQIEAHYSKDEILEAYLNDVYFGRAAYGIEAAARVYFGVAASNLDLAQAAFLAGLPQAPGANDPEEALRYARSRQRYVLDRMLDDGDIDAATHADALAEELHILPELAPPLAPHFVAYALAELARVRPDLAGRQGLIIETTLDAGLEEEAERIAAQQLETLKRRNVTSAAVVVMEPGSGQILAMVGNAGLGASGSDYNMATELRQPGSALKPFLYAAAMDHGYTAASSLLDVQTTFDTPEGPYTPENYDRRFHGPTPLRVALASSYNVPAVRTLAAVGMDTFLRAAARFGLTTLTDSERYGPSLVLGGGEVRLIDLAAAYATLANEGVYVAPVAVTRVRDGAGRVLYEAQPPAPRPVVDPAIAWIITDILRDPDARVPGFGNASPLENAVGAAVKTGTTTGFKDNWAAGYTPSRVVATWVGNADASPMDGVSGVDGAGPIWRDVIEAAAAGTVLAWPAPPAGVVRATVCAPTGLKPGPDCPSPIAEWFVAGTEPQGTEEYYVRDADGTLRVNPPPEALSWAIGAGLQIARSPGAGASLEVAQVQVLAPIPGSMLHPTPELGGSETLLRATATGASSIDFFIDERMVGTSPGSDGRVRWQLVPGRHTLAVRALYPDGSSALANVTFEVSGP